MDAPLLQIKDLKTYFKLPEGLLKAVDGFSLDVNPGEVVGVIGESGCGKSMTGRSLLRIVPKPGYIDGGEMIFRRSDGSVVDIAKLNPKSREMMSIRGGEIGMVFQEPMTSFSPVHTIGAQLCEAIALHVTKDKAEQRRIAIDMLEKVGIGNAAQRMNDYPHQLSGGLRQRAMIAMALCCRPQLLIADEPTTALDVTIQAQIIHLLKELQKDMNMSILYITHDLGVISQICHRVAVVYLGRVVEIAPVNELFLNPGHPYLKDLLRAIPNAENKVERLETIRGTVPVPIGLPNRCGYFDRCRYADEKKCGGAMPEMRQVAEGHYVRCARFGEEDCHG